MRRPLLLVLLLAGCIPQQKNKQPENNTLKPDSIRIVRLTVNDTQRITLFHDSIVEQSANQVNFHPEEKNYYERRDTGSSRILIVHAPDSARTINLIDNGGTGSLDSLTKELKDLVLIIHPPDTSPDWKSWIPLAALLFSIAAIWFTLSNQRRDKIYKDLQFMSEVDKMLVANPELWAFYDNNHALYKEQYMPEEISFNAIAGNFRFDDGSGNAPVEINDKKLLFSEIKNQIIDGKISINVVRDPNKTVLTNLDQLKLEDKIRAFGYFKLNNFEAAMERNYDPHVQAAWDKYMVHTALHSRVFRNILERERRDIVYNRKFKDKIENYLRIMATIEEAQTNNDKDLTNKDMEIQQKAQANKDNREYRNHARYSKPYYDGLENYSKYIDQIIGDECKKMEKKLPFFKRVGRAIMRFLYGIAG